ncbi:hypothetical protein IT570_14290 [Candidatus Sumerlaeota bacterium]|nr:hypothetical protein [Candidatus Sumerlaeota bacterium]
MISFCFCSGEAHARLCDFFGFHRDEKVAGVEVEFREIPYFIVSRSRTAWNPEQGDINAINLLSVNDGGIFVDSVSMQGQPAADGSRRHTFIPWSNVLSMTITRAAKGAEGTAQA